MKIRNGFVSNSSSSSFIVGFQTVPHSAEELQKMLFGNESTFEHPYPGGNYPEGYPASEIAAIAWNDLRQQRPLNDAQVVKSIGMGCFPGHPTAAWELPPAERERLWEKSAREFWDRQKKKFFGTTIFEFHYGDDNSIGCAMEHGDLFRRLPNIRISQH